VRAPYLSLVATGSQIDNPSAKIINVFYRHNRDTRRFLQSNRSASGKIYLRLLALGCLDIVITLPIGILNIVTTVEDVPSLPFYSGWSAQHSNWAPYAVPYSDVLSSGFWDKFEFYFEIWTTPVLSIAVIAIFGLTADVRETWARGISFFARVLSRTGVVRTPQASQFTEIQFRDTGHGLVALAAYRRRVDVDVCPTGQGKAPFRLEA
jgi:hypothetical protein